jgi:hypothetical protein
MTDETLKLLRHQIKERGSNLAAISPAAEELCKVVDHWNALHWADRNRLTDEVKRLAEENKRLKERIDKLEKDEA